MGEEGFLEVPVEYKFISSKKKKNMINIKSSPKSCSLQGELIQSSSVIKENCFYAAPSKEDVQVFKVFSTNSKD